MKPAKSELFVVVFPISVARAIVVCRRIRVSDISLSAQKESGKGKGGTSVVAFEVRRPGMISTSFITGTGFI